MASKENGPSFGAMLLSILTLAEKRQLLLLTPAIALMGLLEAAGVASIVPFLGLLSDPESVDNNVFLSRARQYMGWSSREDLFFGTGLAVLALLTLTNSVSALTTWALVRFSWLRNHTLSTRLLRSYLDRPYEFHLAHNSSMLAASILTEVQNVIQAIVLQSLQLTARFVVLVFVAGVLAWLDPYLALGVTVGFGGAYGTIYSLVRRLLRRIGRERTVANGTRQQVVMEALNGVKEIKLYALEAEAVDRYAQQSLVFSRTNSSTAVVSLMPRFALETIAFGGALIIVLFLLRSGQELHSTLPVLGVYAFAAYRLLPCLQTIFSGLAILQFNLSSLELIADHLRASPGAPPRAEPRQIDLRNLDGHLRADHVCFDYGGSAGRTALMDINLAIAPGEWIAFAGETGAGKSTLADLLLGVLTPTGGRISIDGEQLEGAACLAWQRQVAYVPQQLFMFDDTLTRNICIGVRDDALDVARLQWATRIAQIDTFIRGLPQGYETVIGERGVRLSGGERQRLGIARALYRKPRFVVLDEATSALDSRTEANFFAALRQDLRDTTIISIAHRLSTTRHFDRIYVLERGRIVDVGTFDELSSRSVLFSRSVQESGPPDSTPVAGC